MRILTHTEGRSGPVDDEVLTDLYAPPVSPWLRANMVSTVDGAATGSSGRSGSINNDVDHRVFTTLRSMSDAIVVGAGTAAVEGYGPADRPLVLVSRRGRVPEQLRGQLPGQVLLATCAEGARAARGLLDEADVLVHGDDTVDLAAVVADLRSRGHLQLLCEGGPSLLADLLGAGLVDELCLTVVPHLGGGGDHPRITTGAVADVPLRLGLLLEEDGTLLARWLARRPEQDSDAPAAGSDAG